MGPREELWSTADALAEAVDAFRERLTAADAPDEVLTEWMAAASQTWEAVHMVEAWLEDE